jgi:hypothetical protein
MMSVGNEDFGVGAPLMLGSVFGQRVWRFEQGLLRSPTYRCDWDSGIQEAACTYSSLYNHRVKTWKVRDYVPEGFEYTGYDVDQYGNILVRWNVTLSGDPNGEMPKESVWPNIHYEIEELSRVSSVTGDLRVWWEVTGHTVLDNPVLRDDFYKALTSERNPNEHLDLCSCGFYAYFKGERNIFHGPETPVIGVFEGFGETLIGEKGFRSRKGRIVALAPYSSFYKKLTREEQKKIRRDLAEAYPDIPVFRSAKAMYRKFPLSKAKDFG